MAIKTTLKPAAIKPAPASKTPPPRPSKKAAAAKPEPAPVKSVEAPKSEPVKSVEAPKPAPIKPAKEPKGPKLTDGAYNYPLARLRRIAASVLAGDDKDAKRQLTTGLRQCTTYLDARKFLGEYFQDHQIDSMLNDHYFVARPEKE